MLFILFDMNLNYLTGKKKQNKVNLLTKTYKIKILLRNKIVFLH